MSMPMGTGPTTAATNRGLCERDQKVPRKGSGALRSPFSSGPRLTPLASQLSAKASRARRLWACRRASPRRRRSSGKSRRMTGWSFMAPASYQVFSPEWRVFSLILQRGCGMLAAYFGRKERVMRRAGIAAVSAALLVSGTWLSGQASTEKAFQIADGMQVTLEYTLTLPDKTVADSTSGQAPFSYVHGGHQIISGLEKALVG